MEKLHIINKGAGAIGVQKREFYEKKIKVFENEN